MNRPVETIDKAALPPRGSNGSGRLHFGLDRWRRRRVTIRIAVTLEYSEGGQTVSVPAHTAWVNDEEAFLITQQELPAGLHVELKQSFTGERQAGRVSQSLLKRQDGFYVGVRFESPAPGFWHIIFPSSLL